MKKKKYQYHEKQRLRNQFQMKGDERDMTIIKYTARPWIGSCPEGNFSVIGVIWQLVKHEYG